MDRDLLDKPTGALLLCGPAACGKTTMVLAAAARCHDRGRSCCIVLAPNLPACDAIRRRMLQSGGGLAVGTRVMTFAALAAAVLGDRGQAPATLSSLDRQLLLRRIIRQLAATGKLPALAPVADTPGLARTIDAAIAELKRAAIEPAQLAKVAAAPKHRDLAEIYSRYQQALLDAGLFDTEGLMWLARDRLLAHPSGAPGLDGVRAVLADGFTDFTPTQLDMLHCASRHARVVVTLPVAQAPQRLWRWTQRTRQRLRERLEGLEEVELDGAGAPGPAAACRMLFDADAPSAPTPESLDVISAPGPEAEVAAVARRAKQLLLAGAPAGSIAVLARSLDAYAEPIERIFAQYDLPVRRRPIALTEAPLVRFILAVAALPRNNFAAADVMRVVRSSYFDPAALGASPPEAKLHAQRAILQGNVVQGADAYPRACMGLQTGADDEEDAPDAAGPPPLGQTVLAELARMFVRLFELSRAADTPPGLLAVARELQLARVVSSYSGPGRQQAVAADLRALDAFESALETLSEPYPPYDELVESLAAVGVAQPRSEALVDVLDVLDARPMRWRHVLLLGVSEGAFPHIASEGALIGETQRTDWARRGLPLDSRSDLAAREMLLFYLACSRADRTLTVTFAHSDASGKAQGPSHFLLSLAGGDLDRLEQVGRLERIALGQALSPVAASPREAIAHAVAGAFGNGPFAPAALRYLAASAQLPRLARGLWARSRRWTGGACDEFDGRITHPGLLSRLADEAAAKAFSAHQLNMYAQCPWRYFARYVLGLEPPPEPQTLLEPVARGLFMHGVLCRLMTALARGKPQGVNLAQVDSRVLSDELERAIQQQAAASGEPRYPALWRVQIDDMAKALRAYIQWHLSRGLDAASMHFEWGFGPSPSGSPQGESPPVEVQTSGPKVRLTGRIDRIDRVRCGQLQGWYVVDYKTGRLPRVKDIKETRDVQLAVYVEAAAALLGEPCLGGAFHQVSEDPHQRDFASLERMGSAWVERASFEQDRATARDRLGQYVADIASGRFDLHPDPCNPNCPYRQVCQYSPQRADLKHREPDHE
jgi:superfamily I DNA/RNA helicase/RecB family exonuclease